MTTQAISSISDVGEKVIVTWAAGADGDDGTPYELNGQRALAGCAQAVGTVADTDLEVSNDATNWFPLLDVAGDPITFAAAGIAEFSTSARFIRWTCGTGDSGVTVTIVLRG